jgi:hypothetical protein
VTLRPALIATTLVAKGISCRQLFGNIDKIICLKAMSNKNRLFFRFFQETGEDGGDDCKEKHDA